MIRWGAVEPPRSGGVNNYTATPATVACYGDVGTSMPVTALDYTVTDVTFEMALA